MSEFDDPLHKLRHKLENIAEVTPLTELFTLIDKAVDEREFLKKQLQAAMRSVQARVAKQRIEERKERQ